MCNICSFHSMHLHQNLRNLVEEIELMQNDIVYPPALQNAVELLWVHFCYLGAHSHMIPYLGKGY